MNMSVLGASGYGKSWVTQALSERNTDRYDHVVSLDYKDEYRGLCSKEHGPAPFKHYLAGERERVRFGPKAWAELLRQNGHVVIGRLSKHLDNEDWREVCATIATAARHYIDGSVLLVIDEAHFVAPQAGNYPEPIEGLATTGRGEGLSVIWVSQRPAKLDTTPLGNSTARFLGGFTEKNDINTFSDVVSYPEQVHRAGGTPISGLPEELHAPDEGAITVRKWEKTTPEGEKQVTDSEWIYSDDSGKLARIRSADHFGPDCEHVGASGMEIDVGV
ncbi:MAG: hypothetical protein ACI8XM_000236 [Haloarculaceae archaeon]